MPYMTQRSQGEERNRLYPQDCPVHEWYRFVLSFPPHLVRDYIERFGLSKRQCVLDPFCGTGTTLVECKKQGISSVGVEANPIVQFAARVKTDWNVEPDELVSHAEEVADSTRELLIDEEVEDDPIFKPLTDEEPPELRTLNSNQEKLLITHSISPRPLHKVLALLEKLEELKDTRFYDHERIVLAKQLVFSISNLRFGPEVGIGKAKSDAPVISPWLAGARSMAEDLRLVQPQKDVPTIVHLSDSRRISRILEPQTVDAIITSPPYPNEKDYTRTTRLESVCSVSCKIGRRFVHTKIH